MTTPKRLAILPWGNVIEEYLDSIGLRVDAFATQMSGGWLFGYIEALRHADVESVVICFSEGIQEVTRWKNDSTGAEVVGLPASRGLRGARRVVKGLSHWGLDRTSRCVRYLSSHLATPKEALRLQLQEQNCDAVLVQEYEDSRFDKVVKVGSRMGLPVFAVFQGGQPRRIPFEAIVRSRSIRRCSGLIIGSASETQRVKNRYRLPEAKFARIFNPLDTELWQPDERDETREALGLSA